MSLPHWKSPCADQPAAAACAAALVLLLAAGVARAQDSCTWAPGARPLSLRVDVGHLSVPRGAPVGTVLYDQPLHAGPYGTPLMHCTGGGENQASTITFERAVASMPGYYATNVDGVAIRIDHPGALGGQPFTWPPSAWSMTGGLVVPGPFRVRLVKTGPIRPGALATGPLFSWTAPQAGGGRLSVVEGEIVSGALAVTGSTCDMPSSVPVRLGDLPVTAFTAPGAASPWIDFSLPLRNCPADYTRLMYRLVALDGIRVVPEGAMLDVQRGGATGIGVQIWDRFHDQPAHFGAGQQLIGLPPGTRDVDLPLRARIRQLDPAVAPGGVATAMEVRIEYL